jgi:hypothetical protein
VFGVTCGAAAGVVEVSVTTAGSDPDPDGYLVVVDNGAPQRILTGTMTRFAPVPGGSHTITLRDLAANCMVNGDNPVTGVEVTAGGPIRDTVRVAVSVFCNPRFGALKVVATTNGPGDPDGYVIRLGPSPAQQHRFGANDSLQISNLLAGTYRFDVSDLAGNCSLASGTPNWVTIVGGATLVVGVSVTCLEPAILRISIPTTGPDPDPGYQVMIDGGATQSLLAGGTLELSLPPGEHTVELTDVAPNCTVSGSPRAVVNLSRGATTELTFAVSCVARPRTGLDITVVTTGPDPDDAYSLVICVAADFYCYDTVFSSLIPATTTLQLDLPPKSYSVGLNDVADNCTPRWTGRPTVTAGEVAVVRVDVTCRARASVQVTVTASGPDLQQEFRLAVDGWDAGWIRAGEPVTRSSIEGEHSIGLGAIQANCRVVGPNPQPVILVAGAVTPVNFAVECEPYPVVHASVTTAGSNIPASFLVGVDPDWWYGYQYSTAISPNGSVTFRAGPGPHEIWLDQLPGNCTVDGANPIVVSTPLGSTTEIAFAVICR